MQYNTEYISYSREFNIFDSANNNININNAVNRSTGEKPKIISDNYSKKTPFLIRICCLSFTTEIMPRAINTENEVKTSLQRPIASERGKIIISFQIVHSNPNSKGNEGEFLLSSSINDESGESLSSTDSDSKYSTSILLTLTITQGRSGFEPKTY
ncbi:hypothetical protein H8356DRAFT_1337096 [Neocallimastix lanati (nom. inval.)]|nr:hypothetical protein H8356DRAFT_1337096 [Neocallimastix sp. JGI-2020a]